MQFNWKVVTSSQTHAQTEDIYGYTVILTEKAIDRNKYLGP